MLYSAAAIRVPPGFPDSAAVGRDGPGLAQRNLDTFSTDSAVDMRVWHDSCKRSAVTRLNRPCSLSAANIPDGVSGGYGYCALSCAYRALGS